MVDQKEIIAEAIFDLSKSLRLLGNGNIARIDESPGAIESLVMAIKGSSTEIATALDGIANAIQELAESLDKSK